MKGSRGHIHFLQKYGKVGGGAVTPQKIEKSTSKKGLLSRTISALGPKMFKMSYLQKSCNENGRWKSSYGLTESHSIDFSDQDHQEEVTSSRRGVREADTVIEQKEERYSTSKRIGCACGEQGEDWRRHLFNSRISDSNWVKANTVEEYIFELASRYTLF